MDAYRQSPRIVHRSTELLEAASVSPPSAWSGWRLAVEITEA